MKRKGPRSIPDFSRKVKGRPDTPTPDASAPPHPPAERVVKPTVVKTGKSGRRGS